MSKYPGTLDIIKIDDRWAQVVAVIPISKIHVKYLDNGNTIDEVNLNEYKRIIPPSYGKGVSAVKDLEIGTQIKEKEFEKIHYSASENKDKSFKKLTTVFGEYLKLKKQ